MNFPDLEVKQEQRNARSTEFGNYLRGHGCLVSTWMPEFSNIRRRYGYHLPALDTDALLYNPVTSELLALFETKRGTEELSRAEKEVMLDLAYKCGKPAFVLRYKTHGGSWMIQPVPLNDRARDFRVGDYALYEDEFEDFLSSLGWRGCPPVDNGQPVDTLYFQMIEFDLLKVKSLIDFRPHEAKLSKDHMDAPEFTLWTNMANACGVPALSVIFESSLGWFRTHPLNDAAREYCGEGQYYSEAEFVERLYMLHGQPLVQIDGLRTYRPPTHERRLPPSPPRYQVNRHLYQESKEELDRTHYR